MKKKLLLIVIIFLPLVSLAEEIDGIYYELNEEEKTATVTGVFYSYNTLLIPETVEYNNNEYKVTSIADHAFYQNSRIGIYIIPRSVKSIGDYAFADIPYGLLVYLLSDKILPVPSNVFKGTRMESSYLYVNKELIDEYKSTAPWAAYKYINVLDNNEVAFRILDVGLYNIKEKLTEGYFVYGTQVVETDMGYPLYMIAATELLGDIYPEGNNARYDWYKNYNTSEGNLDENSKNTYVQWYTLMKYITSVNKTISQISIDNDGGSEDIKESALRQLGIIRIYRALFYYTMTVFYEAFENPYTDCSKVKGLTVPIVTENTDEETVKNNPRATHREMVDFILSDLDFAEETNSRDADRVLQIIYGLKARVYLWDEDYANAAIYARKAIDYWSEHNYYWQPMTEEEWEDPKAAFAKDSHGRFMWWTQYSNLRLKNLSNLTGWLSGEADWGYSSFTRPMIDRALYDRIKKTDFRKHVFLDPQKYNYYDYKTVRDRSFIEEAPAYLSLKFRCALGDWEYYGNGAATTVPLMRIEEMFLIEAEAVGASESLAKGLQKLNDFIRTYRDPEYSYTTTSLREFQLEVLTQMRIEFWGEGIAFASAKRLRAGVMQNYTGTNAPNNAFKINCEGIKPTWNFVIPAQAIKENAALIGMNNPDPSGAIIGPSPINEYSSGPYSSGIFNINKPDSRIKSYYTLDGKRVDKPRKGINIVKMSDGTSKKIIR